MRRIRGRGDYQVGPATGGGQRTGIFARLDRALSQMPRGTLARAGANIGNKYGGIVGARVGAAAGAGLSAISGYGDYKVSRNSLSRVSTSVDMIPQFVKNDHSVRVVHREFIKDVAVPAIPADFNNTTYTINPANKDLFPWLATMAKQYSQYKIHGMVFAFKTMSSDYSQSGPLGTIMMATNYNAVDRAFSNKIELENSEFAVSCKPSMSLVHAIECDPKTVGVDILYVRDPSYETTDTSDRRFYDFGKFQIATQGLPGTSLTTLGELWVSYDIEFLKPIIGGSLVSGSTLLSIPTGNVGVSPLARACTVRYTAPAIALTANAVTPVQVPLTGNTITGDTSIDGNVFRLINDNTSWILRNGKYVISYIGRAPNTVANASNFASNALQPVGVSTTNVGLAASVVVTEDPGNVFPATTVVGVSTAGVSYTYVYTITVTGIVNPVVDYVIFRHNTFTSAAASLVSGYQRVQTVTWTAQGVNLQEPGYTPT